MSRTSAILLAALIALLAPAAARAATTFTVDPTAAAGCDAGHVCKTIGAANTAAANGDTIQVKPGTYHETLAITKDLTLEGTGPGLGTVVQPAAAGDDTLTLSGTDTVSNLIVTADGTGGSAIVASGTTTTLTGLIAVRTATAGTAGADPLVEVTGGSATLTGALVDQAVGTGPAVEADSSATVTLAIVSSIVTGSSAGSVGILAQTGALAGTATITASHVTVDGPATGASAADGALATGGTASITATNSIIHGATAATSTTTCTVPVSCTATVTATDHDDTASASTDSTLFVDAAHANLHLKKGSPAINAGGDTPAAGAKDVDGQPRLIGTATDEGADEYDDLTFTTPTVAVAPASPAVGQAVTITPSAVPDAATSNGVDHYTVNFGDGQTATATGPIAHAYATAGTYSVTVVATGRSGAVSPSSAATPVVVGGPGSGGGGGGGGTQAPTLKITSPKKGTAFALTKRVRKHHKLVRVRRTITLKGTASDPAGVKSVQLALLFLGSHKSVSLAGTCKAFDGKRSFHSVSCLKSPFFAAKISDFSWSSKLSTKAKLKKGNYELVARATDNQGRTSLATVVFRMK